MREPSNQLWHMKMNVNANVNADMNESDRGNGVGGGAGSLKSRPAVASFSVEIYLKSLYRSLLPSRSRSAGAAAITTTAGLPHGTGSQPLPATACVGTCQDEAQLLTLQKLADAQAAQSKYHEAAATLQRLLKSLEAAKGEAHAEVLNLRVKHCEYLMESGACVSAEQAMLALLPLLGKRLGFAHSCSLRLQYDLARCLEKQARDKEAMHHYRNTLQLCLSHAGAANDQTLACRLQLGMICLKNRRAGEALEHLEAWVRHHPGTDWGRQSTVHATLAELYKGMNLLEKAQQHSTSALNLALVMHGPFAAESLSLRLNLAHLLIRRGLWPQCVDQFQLLHIGYRHVLGPHHADTLEVQGLLADAWRQLQHHDMAFQIWTEVLAGTDAAQGTFSEESGRICECLVESTLADMSWQQMCTASPQALPYAIRLQEILVRHRLGDPSAKPALRLSAGLVRGLESMSQMPLTMTAVQKEQTQQLLKQFFNSGSLFDA